MTVAEPRWARGHCELTWRPAHPVDVRQTLAPLRRGPGDPTQRLEADGSVWRTTCGPAGPATYRIWQRGLHEVHGEAWGPGAEEVLASLPELLGGSDVAAEFEPRHPLLARAHAANPGLRTARTGRVVEALVPSVLEQKVTGTEAFRGFRVLVQRFGQPAPGPAPVGMMAPPTADVWRRVPSWEWHRAGVGPQRSRTICQAMPHSARIEEAALLSPADAATRLQALPGVGVWTAAEVAQRALGDADALSVGDFHLAALVGWALLGRPIDDDAMIELLEPWRPHRYRVVRLIGLSGFSKPRFGPRLTIQDHRRH